MINDLFMLFITVFYQTMNRNFLYFTIASQRTVIRIIINLSNFVSENKIRNMQKYFIIQITLSGKKLSSLISNKGGIRISEKLNDFNLNN